MRHPIRTITLIAALLLSSMTPTLFAATAEEYYQAGLKLYAANNYNQAVQYFDAAVKLDPNHAGAFRGAGNCWVALNQPTQAVPYYEKALALKPDDAQLAQYVETLKARIGQGGGITAASPAAASPAAVANVVTSAPAASLSQGKALFDQKQYAQAQPLFQQAVAENPSDASGWFYLGYCQYVAKDLKGAALSFSRSNQITPNATVGEYAMRVRSALAPGDQAWVDAELAKELPKPVGAKKAAAVKEPSFGFRFVGGAGMLPMGDIDKHSERMKTHTADIQAGTDLATYPYTDSFTGPPTGLDGNIPTWGFSAALEPYVPLGKNVDMGMHFEYMRMGTYEYTITNHLSGDDEYTERGSMKMTTMPLGLCGRVLFAPPGAKLRPFLGLTALYTLMNMDTAFYWKARDFTPLVQSAKLKGSSFGGVISLGADFSFGKVKLTPYASYRMIKIKNLAGAVTDSRVPSSYDGELRTTTGSGGYEEGFIYLLPSSASLDVGNPADLRENTRPTEVDLSGMMFGLSIGVEF